MTRHDDDDDAQPPPRAPSSPTAPMRQGDLHLAAPDDDDDKPQLPSVRIMGLPLSRVLIVLGLVAAFGVGLARCIVYSREETARATEDLYKGGFFDRR